jgi:hypothetical protein
MTWYAVYDIATGALVSVGTVIAEPLPPGTASQALTAEPTGLHWNATTLAFEAPANTLPDSWTVYTFLKRITSAERIAIRVLAKTDVIAEDFIHLLDQSGDVIRSNPDVLAGLNYLVSTGTLAAGRPSEILNG